MSWSLQEFQQQLALELDRSATAPDTSSTDWSVRTNALNRAQVDWQETYEWGVLLQVHNGIISTSTGNASYVLPTNFKKFDGLPKIVSDGVTAYDFPVVPLSKNRRYVDSDKYVNLIANATTNVMYIHSSQLVSGASVQFSFYQSAPSLATTTSVSLCPDPMFVLQRALYYIYRSREDARFPEAKVESDKVLARMVENESSLGRAYTDRNVSVGSEMHPGWRIGRDG